VGQKKLYTTENIIFFTNAVVYMGAKEEDSKNKSPSIQP
jgi:hypothetical protein